MLTMTITMTADWCFIREDLKKKRCGIRKAVRFSNDLGIEATHQGVATRRTWGWCLGAAAASNGPMETVAT